MNDFPELQSALANNELELARDLLRPLLESQATNPQVWYFASKAARNEDQRRYFLEQAVKLDPLFHQAANELHALNPVPMTEAAPAPRYASAGRRFGAFVVDSLMTFMLSWFSLSLVADFVTTFAAQLSLLLLMPLLVHWLYHSFYYSLRGGMTHGGRLFGLKVIRTDGKRLGFRDAFIRCVVGYIASGIALGAGFTWQFFNPQHQAWHDIIADTVVVEI